MMNNSMVIGIFFSLTVLAVRGDEDTLSNVYHSLNRLGNNVRNTLTEDASDRPSPTPRRHRKPYSKHSSPDKTKTRPAASPSPSPIDKSESSDNASASSKPSPEATTSEAG